MFFWGGRVDYIHIFLLMKTIENVNFYIFLHGKIKPIFLTYRVVHRLCVLYTIPLDNHNKFLVLAVKNIIDIIMKNNNKKLDRIKPLPP